MHQTAHRKTARPARISRLIMGLGLMVAALWTAAPGRASAMTFEMTSAGACSATPCIAATGEIEGATSGQFKAFIIANHVQPGATVALQSFGGDLAQGLMLGAQIRAAGLSTLVQGSGLEGGACASACAYAFLGGVKRTLTADSRVGVHQMRSLPGAPLLGASKGQTLLSQVVVHIRAMGCAMDVFTIALATPAEKMHWFSTAELKRFSLVTG